MAAFIRHIGRAVLWLSLLALLALGLAPASSGAAAPEASTNQTVFLPMVANGAGAPDLRFDPAALAVAPGGEGSTTVRVQPAADLSAATFWLEGAPDSLSVRFQADADGATGTLTLAASD